MVLHLMLQTISWLNVDLITYSFGFVIFYCILALMQKICRNFNSSGTLWIFIASVLMMLECIIYNYTAVNSWQSESRFELAQSAFETSAYIFCRVLAISAILLVNQWVVM